MGKVVFRVVPQYKRILAVQTFPAAQQIAKRIFDLAVVRSPTAGSARDNSGHNDGGPLRDSHFMRTTLHPDMGWILRIGAEKDYAWYVHQGTKPHDIVGNPILRFYWPNGRNDGRAFTGPGVYYFPLVHHPGTKAQPWLWSSAVSILAANSFQSLGGIIA